MAAAATQNVPFVREVPSHPDLREVCVGGGTYIVNIHSLQCGCPHWEKRLLPRQQADPSQPAICKHGEAVIESLQRENACPACRGAGAILLQTRYLAPDATPASPVLRCIVCDGSGKRSAEPLPSQDELKRLFR